MAPLEQAQAPQIGNQVSRNFVKDARWRQKGRGNIGKSNTNSGGSRRKY